MTKPHKIAWCTETWNPIIGCSHASPGCDHCYAERMAARQVAIGTRGYAEVVENGRWNGRTALVKSELEKPLRWRNPHRVFVCSMSDLFHESVRFEWIERVIEVARQTPKHTYLLLTKRAMRLKIVLDPHLRSDTFKHWPLPNVHVGVTIENQKQADARLRWLPQFPAAKRFVSVEPMLSHVDLSMYLCDIDGVICGGESGPGARPVHPDWVRSLRDQCAEAGTKFMFKQWGEWIPEGQDESCTGRGSICVHDHFDAACINGFNYYRVGKHRAGRLLDGREHNEVA